MGRGTVVTRTIHLDPVSRVPASFPSMTVTFGGEEPSQFQGTPATWLPRLRDLAIGQAPADIPDIVSRVCGTCSPMHQLAACGALEAALGVELPPPIHAWRRLLAWGDVIRSHAHHVFLLHAPDFLGFRDAWEMGRHLGSVVAWGLRLRGLGTRMLTLIGGRPVHPVNLRCGGFHHLPDRSLLESLLPDLEAARQDCLEALDWLGDLTFPEFDRPCPGHAVDAPGYPLGALQAGSAAPGEPGDETTLGGPLARFNLHHARLGPAPREAAARAGLHVPCHNPFLSPIIRVVEILQAIEQSMATLQAAEWPHRPWVPLPPTPEASASAQVETARGPLRHTYRIDRTGRIGAVAIHPPSRRVLQSIQADVAAFQPRLAEMPPYRAAWVAGQMVRNHDPCPTCVRQEGDH